MACRLIVPRLCLNRWWLLKKATMNRLHCKHITTNIVSVKTLHLNQSAMFLTFCPGQDKLMQPMQLLICTKHLHGPLARYVKLRVRMRRECRERFPRHRRWAIPTCITARASRTCRDACRDRQLAVSFEIGGGGKRSRHSRRMRNMQFYVSGKRPIFVRCYTHVMLILNLTLLERYWMALNLTPEIHFTEQHALGHHKWGDLLVDTLSRGISYVYITMTS